MSSRDQIKPRFAINVPATEEPGRYANFLTVWNTEHEFTIDFCATQVPNVEQNDDGEVIAVTIPATVTARVKIPPSLIFDVLRALNEHMTKYEAEFGSLHRLRGGGEPADTPESKEGEK